MMTIASWRQMQVKTTLHGKWQSLAAQRRFLPILAATPALIATIMLASVVIGSPAIVLPGSVFGVSALVVSALVVSVMAGLLLWAALRSLLARQAILLDELHTASEREIALEQQLESQIEGEAQRRTLALNVMAETIERETKAATSTLYAGAAQMQNISNLIAASAERSGQTTVMSSEAADGSVESARQLAETAERLDGAIHSIAEQVSQATGITADAVAASTEAKRVIATLTDQVLSIHSITDLIRAVAAQTNLLALNATIEAARAGEAGRGFAVVAGEVKALAQQTAQSTESIVQAIGAIRGSNTAAVSAVERIGVAVSAIDQIAAAISVAVHEQRAATSHIADSVNRTLEGANRLSEQITNMTVEVGTSFENAAEVHSTASAITADTQAMIDEFNQILVRAVRNAAPEVNRRQEVRHAVDLNCMIALDGQPAVAGRVLDWSQSGARLTVSAETIVSVGARGLLTIKTPGTSWTGRRLAFITVGAKRDGETCQLRLRLTERGLPPPTLSGNAAVAGSQPAVSQPAASQGKNAVAA